MGQQQPMTEAMYYILLALLHPSHGYGMMQRIRELSGGRLVMGPGTLYGVLTRMRQAGWITLQSQDERRKASPHHAGRATGFTRRISKAAAFGARRRHAGGG